MTWSSAKDNVELVWPTREEEVEDGQEDSQHEQCLTIENLGKIMRWFEKGEKMFWDTDQLIDGKVSEGDERH